MDEIAFATRFSFGTPASAVMAFLQGQTAYQLNRRIVRAKVVKPVITTRPNQRIQVDLIFMEEFTGHNSDKRFLLTVIDCFSKKAWVFALPNRESRTIAAKLRLPERAKDSTKKPRR